AGKLEDAGTDTELVRHIAQCKIEIQRAQAQSAAGRYGLQFGGKLEPASAMGIVERLLSCPVSGDKQSPGIGRCSLIINREREHAVETRDRIRTPSPVSRQDNFGVASTAKPFSCSKQFISKFDVVVDLAIEDDNIPSALTLHRLMAKGRKFQDREPA